MSAAVRAELAAAVNGAGAAAKCAPYFVQATKPGSAWVRRDRTEYPNRFGGVVTWQIVVVLPPDLASAEKYADEKGPVLVEALADHLVVTSVTPQQIVLDDHPPLKALFIEGHREE